MDEKTIRELAKANDCTRADAVLREWYVGLDAAAARPSITDFAAEFIGLRNPPAIEDNKPIKPVREIQGSNLGQLLAEDIVIIGIEKYSRPTSPNIKYRAKTQAELERDLRGTYTFESPPAKTEEEIKAIEDLDSFIADLDL